jgi:hypothetical protein
MKNTVVFVTVRVNIVHRDDISSNDAIETVMSEMDYDMTYDHDGVRIAGTEIMEQYSVESEPFHTIKSLT